MAQSPIANPLANEQSLFEAARALPPGDARQAYLQQACENDAALHQRILALLAAYDESESFLESPHSLRPTPIADLPAAEQPGATIGPYKLLEIIGEGGMGIVYRAEQKQPVERTVALKIIKPGLDTRHVIARFEAERQALALMDHPNIARVLDAGTTGEKKDEGGRMKAESSASSFSIHPSSFPSAGRPYFVMELVHGIPITKYCDQQHLNVRERLELMISVCQAIQHAHQKGIIHRDIKPSNVLVTQYDGHPVPKVIDFGVAKAIQTQSVTEQLTQHTHLGQIIGTLEYMSPEQAELNPRDIDTRSDIYSLGVLLYELLTGVTPFDQQHFRAAAFHEMLRIIREEEPERPSARLSKVGCAHQNTRGVGVSPAQPKNNRSTSTDTSPHTDTSSIAFHASPHTSLASIAALRNIEPARLTQALRGELDWIVMKALEKDRTRRYDTASSFALDLQCYLNDEAVTACPPSAAYRFCKFARRNRAALTTAALFLVLLIFGVVVSTWQAIRATNAENLAKVNELRAIAEERKATAALAAEAVQRERAERQAGSLEEHRKLLENNQRVNALVVNQVLSTLRTLTTDDATRREIITFAMDRLSDLDPQARTAAYCTLGNILFSSGQVNEAFRAFQDGLKVDPHNAALYISRGDAYFRRSNYAKAAADYTAAIENRIATDPANTVELPYCRRGFANHRLKKYDEMIADFNRSYDALPEPTMQFVGRHFSSGITDVFTSSVNDNFREGFLTLLDRHVADSKNSTTARTTRVNFLALFREYDRAEAGLETIRAAGNLSPQGYYELALLAVGKDDLSRYRELCRTMVEKFGDNPGIETFRSIARACRAAPHAVDDYTPLLKIARKQATQQPTSSTAHELLGSLLFRAGEYQEARQHLEAAIRSEVDVNGADWHGPYLIAMASYQLGQQDEALRILQSARKQQVHAGHNWRFRLILDRFEKEATQLITATPGQANGDD